MTDVRITRLDRLELAFVPRPWPFATERRAEIDRYFVELRRRHPGIWNGRALLLHDHRVEDAVFRGSCLETDFASFIAWRDWGFPDPSVKNCFALGAMRSSDGAFIAGVMGSHTANSGKIYFPAGTPDPSDVIGTSVDLAGSIRREVAEETGIGPCDYDAQDGWCCVATGPRLAFIKRLQLRASADELRARILAHLAREPAPELADVRILRGPADLDPMMPAFMTAFLTDAWSRARP